MEDTQQAEQHSAIDIRSVVRSAIQEFLSVEQSKAEPAHKAELLEERRRREHLEAKLNEVIEENRRNRQIADEMERSSVIRTELQRLGVAKIDLAFRAVKDEIHRSSDGKLFAQTDNGEVGYREYLSSFVQENPELLPARITGGSGVSAGQKQSASSGTVDLDKIKPGMSPEELARVREEISRIAMQSLQR